MTPTLLLHAPLTGAVLILLIGIWMILRERNLIRILMGLGIIESAVNLFLVAIGYRHDALAPIYTGQTQAAPMVLPTVQALTLTSIVIGLATTAMLLSLTMTLHRRTGSIHVDDMRKLKQ